MAVIKMLCAWLIAVLVAALSANLRSGRGVSPDVGESLLGLGLILGLPMLLFSFVVALPISALASRLVSPYVAVALYPFMLAAAAWIISLLVFPDGWKGAQQAIILFAFVQGVAWGLLSFVGSPSLAGR